MVIWLGPRFGLVYLMPRTSAPTRLGLAGVGKNIMSSILDGSACRPLLTSHLRTFHIVVVGFVDVRRPAPSEFEDGRGVKIVVD